MDPRFAPSGRPVRRSSTTPSPAPHLGRRRPPPAARRRPLELGLAAHEVRNRFNDPAVASYNVDRNINYTNICVYKCRFCAFYRAPGDPEGYLLPFEEIGRKIEETLALNGTGILLQGGVHPDLGSQYYEDL
jgi:cyclic dehypoxanthinyl futalosine synthase